MGQHQKQELIASPFVHYFNPIHRTDEMLNYKIYTYFSSHVARNGSSAAAAIAHATMQRNCAENSKQIFPDMKLRRLVPNSYMHDSVGDLYIPTISLPIQLQENRWTDPAYINRSQIYMNVEIRD